MNLKTLESFSMCWILLSTASVLYLVLGFISFRFHHPPQALSLLTIKFVFYYWTQHFHVLCAMKREKKNLKKSHSLCIQAKILWYDIWVHLRSSIPWKSPWSHTTLVILRLLLVVFLNWIIYHVSLTNVFLHKDFLCCVLICWVGPIWGVNAKASLFFFFFLVVSLTDFFVLRIYNTHHYRSLFAFNSQKHFFIIVLYMGPC